VDERDVLGKQFIEAELDDGMRLAAADLHDVPGSGRDPRDLTRILPGEIRIAVFVEIFHGCAA
jgi:hypothetical protein